MGSVGLMNGGRLPSSQGTGSGSAADQTSREPPPTSPVLVRMLLPFRGDPWQAAVLVLLAGMIHRSAWWILRQTSTGEGQLSADLQIRTPVKGSPSPTKAPLSLQSAPAFLKSQKWTVIEEFITKISWLLDYSGKDPDKLVSKIKAKGITSKSDPRFGGCDTAPLFPVAAKYFSLYLSSLPLCWKVEQD
ncbi:uncharacterized protein LOC118164008 [Oxyura jamaicensis]|uniref:uncharacterized protein LOC118164008 n=1 Tax=Oxyura jamaicensis TaxID=8884 RepID=UPI0015A5900B|nr:uncharacterized protein LOC118164008 [Oxyura jamaicensis]